MSNRALVYRTAPNAEHKAAQELREAGIRAYVPRDRGGKRNPFTGKRPATAPGYVSASSALSSAYAKHVRAPLGSVDKAELQRLYIERPQRRAMVRVPYTIGQEVMHGEVPGVVAAIEDEVCIVATVMFHKQHLQPVHYSRLRPG